MADEEAKDLRSMLAEAAIEVENAGASETLAEPKATSAPAVAEEIQSEQQSSDGRPRDASGRFLPKEGEEGSAAAPEIAPSTETAPKAASEPASPGAVATEPPAHWSQADKEWVSGLPAEHRASVVERFKAIEAGFTPKLQKLSQFEKEYGGASELLSPYRDIWAQQGRTASDAIKIWASLEQTLLNSRQSALQGRPDPIGAQVVAGIISNYRIDPGEVARFLQGQQQTLAPANGEAAGHQNGYAADPALVNQVQQITNYIRQDADQRRLQAETAAQAQIDSFVAEKNPDGTLKRPFYSELEPAITELARFERSQGRTPSLGDLYEKAVWANQSTRDRQLSSQRQADEKRAAEDRKAKADAARKASSSVSGAPSPGSTSQRTPSARSLRADLEAAAEEANAAIR